MQTSRLYFIMLDQIRTEVRLHDCCLCAKTEYISLKDGKEKKMRRNCKDDAAIDIYDFPSSILEMEDKVKKHPSNY